MHVMVLGAGVTGVTTAWYLLQAGFEVSVVERRPGPALETSFANGGQISVSHPEPWSSPAAPMIALRSVGRAEAPLRLRIGMEPARWRWMLSFLRECQPTRHLRNADAIASLAVHSADCLRQLRADTGLQYEERTRGILHLLYNQRELEHADLRLALLNRHGIPCELHTPDECATIDPSLAHIVPQLAGGLYAPNDESGNARLFTERLAELATRAGARFHFDSDITSLELNNGRISAVQVRTVGNADRLSADAFVLCLGSHGTRLLAPHGEHLPIYPVKGYSVSVPVVDETLAPTVSLTDESRRLVASRLGGNLRVAGTAEVTGYDASPNPARIRPLLRWVDELFPGACDTARAEAWAGLRPCTPSYVPIIGRSKVEGLWLNTGHGSLGWTLACGSAQLVSTLLSGRDSNVPDFPLHRR